MVKNTAFLRLGGTNLKVDFEELAGIKKGGRGLRGRRAAEGNRGIGLGVKTGPYSGKA
jgi:hypothetical protein